MNANIRIPSTEDSLISEFSQLGLQHDDILLVHSSLSSLGWVCGGEQTVIRALQATAGTLVMPTHTPDNTNPSNWIDPPVPDEKWCNIICQNMPAFDKDCTPTSRMGRIPECFRKFPNVERNQHPIVSFCAWGKYKKEIVGNLSLGLVVPDLGLEKYPGIEIFAARFTGKIHKYL
jgi:aminoglycoside 3-N-acetyltransferase